MKWKKVYAFINIVRTIPHSNKEKDLAKYYAQLKEEKKSEDVKGNKKRGE